MTDEIPGLDEADRRRLARLKRVAYVLDDAFEVPIIGRRIGVDALLGLVPVAGDLAGGALSTWVLYNGYRLGASWPTLLRMLGNVFIELLVGAVPLLGDLFDMGFKANQRNVRLLLKYGQDAGGVERRSAIMAVVVIGGLALVVLGSVILVGWLVVSALGALVGLVSGAGA
ncbi:MAG: DUF4112 domain-containing protein [Pseudomonadota bacterium]